MKTQERDSKQIQSSLPIGLPDKGYSDNNPYLNEILEDKFEEDKYEESSESYDMSLNDSENIERFDEIFLENALQRQVNKLLD